MSDTGRSHQRSRQGRSSRPSQDSIARQSGRPYEGTSGGNSSTSSRAYRDTGGYDNRSRGNLTASPALHDYIRRPSGEDPWTPETARYAYGDNSHNTYNSSSNSTSGNGGYNYPPSNRQYNDPYNNAQRDNAYDNPYNHASLDRQYNNPYNNNNANGPLGLPPYTPRNGRSTNGESSNRATNGESSNARLSYNYGNNYDTPYGRSSNSEYNQDNTSNRSRNSHPNSRR